MNIKLKKQSNKYKVYNGDQYLCSIPVKDVEDDTITDEQLRKEIIDPIKEKLLQKGTPEKEIADVICKVYDKLKLKVVVDTNCLTNL